MPSLTKKDIKSVNNLSVAKKLNYAKSFTKKVRSLCVPKNNFSFLKHPKYNYFNGYIDGIYDEGKTSLLCKNKNYAAGYYCAKTDLVIVKNKKK